MDGVGLGDLSASYLGGLGRDVVRHWEEPRKEAMNGEKKKGADHGKPAYDAHD